MQADAVFLSPPWGGPQYNAKVYSIDKEIGNLGANYSQLMAAANSALHEPLECFKENTLTARSEKCSEHAASADSAVANITGNANLCLGLGSGIRAETNGHPEGGIHPDDMMQKQEEIDLPAGSGLGGSDGNSQAVCGEQLSEHESAGSKPMLAQISVQGLAEIADRTLAALESQAGSREALTAIPLRENSVETGCPEDPRSQIHKRGIACFLPKSINLRQLSDVMAEGRTCEVERNFLENRFKSVTVYHGPCAASTSSTGAVQLF